MENRQITQKEEVVPMVQTIEETKKQVLHYLIYTFGLTFAMNGLLYMAIKSNIEGAAMNFAGIQMLYPALIAMYFLKGHAKTLVQYNKLRLMTQGYFAVTGLSMLILITATFLKLDVLMGLSTIPIALYSFVLIIFLMFDKKGSLDGYKLNFKTGFFPGLAAVGVYALLSTVVLVLSIALESTLKGKAIDLSSALDFKFGAILVAFLIALLSSSAVFIGEEMGWRLYLQPLMQKIFGQRLGIIAVGVVWGLWHGPLNFMLYNPQTPLLGMLNHVIFCTAIGIFLAYIYLKTDNLWPCVLIHLFQNARAATLNPSFESVLTFQSIAVTGLVFLLVFSPFLFTKQFKRSSISEPTLDLHHQQEL